MPKKRSKKRTLKPIPGFSPPYRSLINGRKYKKGQFVSRAVFLRQLRTLKLAQSSPFKFIREESYPEASTIHDIYEPKSLSTVFNNSRDAVSSTFSTNLKQLFPIAQKTFAFDAVYVTMNYDGRDGSDLWFSSRAAFPDDIDTVDAFILPDLAQAINQYDVVAIKAVEIRFIKGTK